MITAHEHEPVPISHTLEGPLKVLMGCRCGKTEAVTANPRLRKLPWGFNEKSWSDFLEAGRKRLEGERARG